MFDDLLKVYVFLVVVAWKHQVGIVSEITVECVLVFRIPFCGKHRGRTILKGCCFIIGDGHGDQE